MGQDGEGSQGHQGSQSEGRQEVLSRHPGQLEPPKQGRGRQLHITELRDHMESAQGTGPGEDDGGGSDTRTGSGIHNGSGVTKKSYLR